MSLPDDRVVRVVLPKSPRRCFDAFTDVRHLVVWVPELKRALAVEVDAAGRPLHVKFELGESLTYSILYTYDVDRLRIDFRPGVGAREAVTGFAEFAPHEAGCSMTYGITTGVARGGSPGPSGDPVALTQSFARWLASTP